MPGKQKWSKERILQATNEVEVFSLKEQIKKICYSEISSFLIFFTYRLGNSNILTLCS